MSKYELCTSLLKWLQTFQLGSLQGSYRTLDDITDGVAIANVLHQIAPEWFSKNWLAKIKTDVGVNWRLKVSNLKKIIEGITDYYQEYINPSINFVKPDAVRIGEHKDLAEMVKLLQLILGCAVSCNHKQGYIKQIMEMEESVQNVIMQSIQELENILGSSPISFSSSSNLGSNSQIDQLENELQITNEARNQLSQRCMELDLQLNRLQEEKNILVEEKQKLEEKLRVVNIDPTKGNAVRKQIDALKEEIFKLETSRDDYRLKLEMQEKDINELMSKCDVLQQATIEARHLKDEIDILREKADKAEKLENIVQTYKKKLEDSSELRRERQQLEDKNLAYVQQILELEEEVKKANTWKTQSELYKKQVAELRVNLLEETKKLDKIEFENSKAQEKLNALEKEKERLIIERDSLKEANEELLCSKLQIKGDSSDLPVEGKSSSISDGMTSAMEMKRELVKLQHENTLLKINMKQSEDEKLPILQTIYDDLSQQHKQLQLDYRQTNQKILQLEAEIKDNVGDRAGSNASVAIKELQNQLQVEKTLRISENCEKDRLSQELILVKSTLFEALRTKEQECEEIEDKYRRCLEKARSIAKCLDLPELSSIGDDLNISRNKVSNKDHILEDLEKQFKQDKFMKDNEEKLLATAFYNFAQKKQQELMDQRLINTNNAGGNVPYLARQRQSASRRLHMQVPYNTK